MQADPCSTQHSMKRLLRAAPAILAGTVAFAGGILSQQALGQVPSILGDGPPVQVVPCVPEPGVPALTITPGTANPFTGADGSGGSSGGTGDGGTGGNVGGSDALSTMLSQPWGLAAVTNAQAVGLNPSALAATCVAESGCNGNQGTVAGQSAQGTFQMQPAAYAEGIARAEAADPALASQVVPGNAGRFDPTSAAIAASGYLLKGADALQAAGVADPTVLDTRAYFVFGPGPGPSVATADDSAPLSNYVSQAAISQNHWPPTETVGQWRASVSSAIGNAANQSVLNL